MSHKTAFSTQARVLLCQHCGAPIEVANAGGLSPCSFCEAQNRIVGRSEAGVAPAREEISEQERFSRLRAQCDRPWRIPESLKPFYENGAVPDWKMDEALAVWKQTRATVESTNDHEAAERLLVLTVILAQTYGAKRDPLRHRAIFESSLDAFTLPRHRQVILCGLSRGAIAAKDRESAEEWLRLCDAHSDDIESDSEYRQAWATIHTHARAYDRVLEVLGAHNDTVPIQQALWDVCVLFRANALERLGRTSEAVAALQQALARPNGRGTMSMLVGVWDGFCPESYPRAQQAASHAAASPSKTPLLIGLTVGVLGIAGLFVFAVMKTEERRLASRPLATTATPPPITLVPIEPALAYADAPSTKRVVTAMRSGFKRCLDKGLAANPKLRGSSMVLAEIDGTGKVSAATASGSLPAELNACLQKEVLASAFPPPREGHATLSIPVTFDAR